MRLKAAEKAFVPSTPPLSLQFGDEMLVYRETEGIWEPRTFVSRDDNMIFVMEPGEETQPYSKTKVSEYKGGKYLPRPDLYGIEYTAQTTQQNSKDNSQNLISLPETLKTVEQIELTEVDEPYKPIQVL